MINYGKMSTLLKINYILEINTTNLYSHHHCQVMCVYPLSILVIYSYVTENTSKPL
jgi:hypothetical protein